MFLLCTVSLEIFFCLVDYEILVALVVPSKSVEVNTYVMYLERFTMYKEKKPKKTYFVNIILISQGIESW